MKKIVILSSSPRINSNSDTLAHCFEKGAIEAGHHVDFFNIAKMKINYCHACDACKKIGHCIQKDDMSLISDKLIKADVIVFATPLYFYSMSAQLKTVIDRFVPFYETIKSDIYIIIAGWDDDINNYQKAVDSIRGCTVDCFVDCQEKGVLLAGGLPEFKEVEKHPEYLKQAYLMGKNC